MSLPQSLATLIDGWCLTTGMSRPELARRVGVDRTQISRWLAGEGVPQTNTLTALLRETGASVDAARRIYELAGVDVSGFAEAAGLFPRASDR